MDNNLKDLITDTSIFSEIQLGKIRDFLFLIDEKMPTDISQSEYIEKLKFYSMVIEWANNDVYEASQRFVSANVKAARSARIYIAENVPSNKEASEEQKNKAWDVYGQTLNKEFYDHLRKFAVKDFDSPPILN